MKLKRLLLPPTAFLSALLVKADHKSFGDGTLPEYLRQYDVNEDGRIDEEERQAIKAARKAARDQQHAEIDTDGDGQISAVESETARNFIRTKISEKRV